MRGIGIDGWREVEEAEGVSADEKRARRLDDGGARVDAPPEAHAPSVAMAVRLESGVGRVVWESDSWSFGTRGRSAAGMVSALLAGVPVLLAPRERTGWEEESMSFGIGTGTRRAGAGDRPGEVVEDGLAGGDGVWRDAAWR